MSLARARAATPACGRPTRTALACAAAFALAWPGVSGAQGPAGVAATAPSGLAASGSAGGAPGALPEAPSNTPPTSGSTPRNAFPPPGPVRAPHYGDALYLFFQGRHFSALTGLMASQQQRRLAPHDDETEVLRGGLLLGYGLHREAGEIFERLIERGAAPSVRDRAWFFLARLRHQRGLLPEAEAALDRVGSALPAALEEDRQLLKGQLLLARGDAAAAAAWLQAARQTPAGAASRYLRFNLGVALIRSGEVARGQALLAELGQAPAPDEETRALRDKANLALGFAALRDGAPRDARAHLQRVRLRSLEANAALLGFGWAADALDDPRAALVPWTELRSRDGSDAAVLEARLAVPHALAALGAYGQAMDDYRAALDAYGRERTALDDSIAAVRAGTLVRALMDRVDGEAGQLRSALGTGGAASTAPPGSSGSASSASPPAPSPSGSSAAGPTVGAAAGADLEADARRLGGFWAIARLPEMPHPGHLAPVLAGHDFQEAFKSLRDLQFLGQNLERWEAALGSYQDMLAHRQAYYQARLPVLQAALAGAVGPVGPNAPSTPASIAANGPTAATRASAATASTPASGPPTDRMAPAPRSAPGSAAASAPPAITLSGLQADRDARAAEFATAEAAADGRAFATERETRLQSLIDRSRATLERLAADPSLAALLAPEGLTVPPDAADRLRRAEGALGWNLARALPERQWVARKALSASEAALAEARTRATAIVQAQQDEPARHAAFAARIEALRQRIAELRGPVAVASAEQQQVVQALAVAVLERQKERLDGYTEQARFAVAQLHDRALNPSPSGPGGATGPGAGAGVAAPTRRGVDPSSAAAAPAAPAASPLSPTADATRR